MGKAEPRHHWHLSYAHSNHEEWGDTGMSLGWPFLSPTPVPTCVLLQQLPAGAVAGFGSLHTRGLLRQGEDLGEAELSVPAPPALAARSLPQPRVLGCDLLPDAELVGDVPAALCQGRAVAIRLRDTHRAPRPPSTTSTRSPRICWAAQYCPAVSST